MKKLKMAYNTYKNIIKTNKNGKWKLHPMRSNKFSHTHPFIPLWFKIANEGWMKVFKCKSFAHVQITRKLGKNQSLANQVLMTANKNGQYIVDEDEVIKYRESSSLLKSDINEI